MEREGEGNPQGMEREGEGNIEGERETVGEEGTKKEDKPSKKTEEGSEGTKKGEPSKGGEGGEEEKKEGVEKIIFDGIEEEEIVIESNIARTLSKKASVIPIDFYYDYEELESGPYVTEDSGLSAYLKVSRSLENVEVGSLQKNLPTYSKEEIADHDCIEKEVWVIYKNGVYNVTNYTNRHPGGKILLLAAGQSIEPFWTLYAVHNTLNIFKILERLRIGNYIPKPEDLPKAEDASDPYANDPIRHSLLIPSSEKPYNAKPPLGILTNNFVTPKEIFYIRNHLPVPQVDIEKFRLEVVTIDDKIISFSLDELKKFPKHQVTAIIHCSHNCRGQMESIKSLKGLDWGNAAIGNGVWTGVRLVDVFKHAWVDTDNPEYKHIQFEGLDIDPTGMPYGAFIPIDLFDMIKNDIILAYEMNGEEITADHGYPLRVIIPGVIGARQVKWLKKVLLIKEESLSHWQQMNYKGFNPSIDWHNADSIQQYPVHSAICVPAEGSSIDEDEGEIKLQGYAWSGGGRAIIRVDVSINAGKTWKDAEIRPNEQSLYCTYAWTLWYATIPIPANHKGKLELVCKATDVSYNTQPDSVEGIWNLRGVLSNAWNHITVKVNPVPH